MRSHSRVVAVAGALLGFLALGSSTAVGSPLPRSGPSPSTRAGNVRPTLGLLSQPKGALNRALAHRPVNPRNAPRPPLPGRVAARYAPVGRVTHRRVARCYSLIADGYQADCLNPGFEWDVAIVSHYGNEPFYNSGYRFVWVMDELVPGSAESQHLQAVINAFNSVIVAGKDRPYFLYYQKANFPGWTSCNVHARQWLEVCYNPSSGGSFAQWDVDSAGHFVWGINAIGDKAPDDGEPYLGNAVTHEFGHTIGFAHDTNCKSVMTYCSTFFTQPLSYFTDQVSVYQQLYDRHATN